MIPNRKVRGPRGLHLMKAVPSLFMLVIGNQAFAQTKTSADITSNSVSVGEIILYVVLILVVIAIAWFFGAGQSKKMDEPTVHQHPHARRHYDHPNDPHFRKLKRKTS